MALEISKGPSDWSISAENGQDMARFVWTGYPNLTPAAPEYYIRYVVTRNGKQRDSLGNEVDKYVSAWDDIGPCENTDKGQWLPDIFSVGSWTVQFFYCRDNSRRILTNADRASLDSGMKPTAWKLSSVGSKNNLPLYEEILETSNKWTFEVTA